MMNKKQLLKYVENVPTLKVEDFESNCERIDDYLLTGGNDKVVIAVRKLLRRTIYSYDSKRFQWTKEEINEKVKEWPSIIKGINDFIIGETS